MGYMRHHAIVVTSWSKHIEQAHAKAHEVFDSEDFPFWTPSADSLVSPIINSLTNGFSSFFIAPDGSKSGWDTSDIGNNRRGEYIAWLEDQRYDDLSSPFDWVEIQYGDDDKNTRVTRDSDMAARAVC